MRGSPETTLARHHAACSRVDVRCVQPSRASARWIRLALVPLVIAAALALGALDARADINQTPIAIPLLGDIGTGSPYPSRIHVAARGGPAQTGRPFIMLHAVTHPCPEDLALLLVHNGTEKFLLMSHAGGCRPLAGTSLFFTNGAGALPDSDPSVVPYGESLVAGVSNYGPAPVFPAPAPAGPYLTTFPNTSFDGTWELYVLDTAAGNRGVVAAGWSFNYPTQFPVSPSVGLPSAIPGAPAATVGPAATYPLTFDLSGVPAGVKARGLRLAVTLSHAFPDDLNLILQAPNGLTTLIMSNAGGSDDIVNVALAFADSAAAALSDAGAIAAGTYKPSAYGTQVAAPGVAPAPPHGATLGVLENQDARGIWRLWVYDDSSGDAGSISAATLTVTTEFPPIFNIDSPTSAPTFTANTPFLRLEGEIEDLLNSPHSASWYSRVGGTYYQSGPMIVTPGSQIVKADIPLKKGLNNIVVFVRNTAGTGLTLDEVDVTVNEFVYALSEGATGGFFDLDVTMANPTGAAAPVSLSFLPEHSAPIPFGSSVPANGQLQLRVDDLTPADGVSTVVRSVNAVPLAVERTMSWDATGYGGSGGTAIVPHTRWLFAEGAQGFFDTFILLANDSADDANVAVKFLFEGGSPVTRMVPVAAHSRVTVFAGDTPAARSNAFGLDISSDRPITAERSMYFPHDAARVWEGGHEAAGANATSRHWFLAEGATGSFFQCYILLSNPTASVAHTTISYLLPDGTTVPQTVNVPANGRFTIDVAGVDPRLRANSMSTTITSDVGIIAERSMYWPSGIAWREAHNSIGVVDPALRWAISDGRLGGPRGLQTYILLANPNATPAEVQIRFLKAGLAPIVRNVTLPPTSRTTIAPGGDIPGLGDGVFSADIQVVNYQPIVVEKAMYWNSAGEVWAAGTGTVGTPIPPQ